MQHRAWFWSFVATLGAPHFDEDHVSAQFATLSEDQLVAVEWHVRDLSRSLGTLHVYGALRAIDGSGLSDDGFEYVRYWLVFQGDELFAQVLGDPDSLADRLSRPCADQFLDWMGWGEWLGYAAVSEWKHRGLDEEILEARVGIPRGSEVEQFDWREAARLDFPRIARRCGGAP